MNEVTFSSRLATDLIKYAQNKGGDASVLYELLGLPESRLDREDVRISSGKMAQVWRRAMELSGDDDLGFHMGVETNAAALRTTSLIMQSSATVREAFEKGIEYSVLIANALTMRIGEEAGCIYIEFTPREQWRIEDPVVIKDCLNITMVSMLASVTQLTGGFHAPALLRLSYPKPKNLNEYYRVFNCRMSFDQPCNRLGFPKDLGRVQIPTRDKGLMAVLQDYANEVTSSFTNQHRHVAVYRR